MGHNRIKDQKRTKMSGHNVKDVAWRSWCL